MKSLTTLLSSIIAATICFSGCTHKVVLSMPNINTDKIPVINSKEPLALISSIQNDNDTKLCQIGFHEFIGNMHDFDMIAIKTISNTLQSKGVNINDKANKRLKIAVNWNCNDHFNSTSLKVSGDDGYNGYYSDITALPIGWLIANTFERSLASSIEKMFFDAKFVAYLTKESALNQIISKPSNE